MKRKVWTAEETAELRLLYSDTPMHVMVKRFSRPACSIYHKAGKLGLKRSAEFLASPMSGRMRPGSKRGGNTRFKSGHKPWNKGMKGLDIGGKATQFKPGNLSGTAAENLKPIGFERVTDDGILQRKIRMDGPPQHRWKSVHSILWEEHHGPIPSGHIIVFKDGNRKNIVIENLELITRGEHMKRNTIHNLPEQLVDTIRTKGVLTRRINRLRKRA